MSVADLFNRLKDSPVGKFFEKYGRDQAPMYATLIAYNAILAMFPIMLALLAIVGVFVQDERALQTVNRAIVQVLPAAAEDEALKVIQASRAGPGAYGLVGFLGLLWGGSALFGTMADAFNRAFAISGRGFIGQKLMAFGMVFVFAFLMLFSLIATNLAGLLLGLSQDALSTLAIGITWLEMTSAYFVSLGLGFLMFLSIYWIVPNRPFRFGQVWPGALVSAVLFFLIQQAWPIYIATLGRFGQFGAVFGLFILIVTWFYFLAHIVMLGAEMNASLLERHRHG